MRSPLAPVLVILGLATTLVLVLLLFQALGIRDEIARVNDRVGALQDEVASIELGIGRGEHERQLNDLESALRAAIAAGGSGADPDQQGSGQADGDEILERLDDVIDRIDALDRRLDEICEGVPVC